MNIVLYFLLILANFLTPLQYLPVTGTAVADTHPEASLPHLSDFITSVTNGKSNQLVGVYVPDLMAFPVVQQPSDQAGYVSAEDGVLTQFAMASDYGSIGLLAHNQLAGSRFDKADINQIVVLIYGDGSTRLYHIYAIQRYQALNPNDPRSSFIGLEDNNTYSAEEVFYKTYGVGEQNLILQTCIAADGEDSWGRLFLMAHPLEKQDILLLTSFNSSLHNLVRGFLPQAEPAVQ